MCERMSFASEKLYGSSLWSSGCLAGSCGGAPTLSAMSHRKERQNTGNISSTRAQSPLSEEKKPRGVPGKKRADQLIYEQGLSESREQARRLIMAGQVLVMPPEGSKALPVRVDKPGHMFSAATVFSLIGQEQYVSRGAYKLLTILESASLDVTDYVCLDAGASTGGFTDCLLQRGAQKVYAVDVGRNQLHERLRADPRVINLEGVNLRTAEPSLIPEPVDIVVADVSFISLTLVLEPCMAWLKPGGWVAALIKPQFELGPGQTVKGVVRSEQARQQAIDKVVTYAREVLHLDCLSVVPAAIKGPKGNQEYLALMRRHGA